MVKEKALIPLIPIDWFLWFQNFWIFDHFLAEIRDTFIRMYGGIPVQDHVKVGLWGVKVPRTISRGILNTSAGGLFL